MSDADKRINAFLGYYLTQSIMEDPEDFIAEFIPTIDMDDQGRTKEEWLNIMKSGIDQLGIGTERKKQ